MGEGQSEGTRMKTIYYILNEFNLVLTLLAFIAGYELREWWVNRQEERRAQKRQHEWFEMRTKRMMFSERPKGGHDYNHTETP